MPPPARPPIERFNEKWEEDSNGCWIWTAYKDKGYGRFYDGTTVVGAHRWSYEHHNGEIPPDLVVNHICENPSCVNPEHLEVVTNARNVLIGYSKSAQNSRKVLCVRGHEFDGIRILRGRRTRFCKQCKVIRDKKRRPGKKKANE